MWTPDDPEGRARLVDRMWGDDAARTRLLGARLPAARRAKLGLVLGAGLYGATYAATGDPILSAGFGLFGGVVGLATSVTRGLRYIPSATTALPRWPRLGPGHIISAAECISPGSLMRCAAWAVELRYTGSWGTRTTLRAGASAGLDIALEGEARLRVAPGALWIASSLVQLDGDDTAVDDLVRWLDPADASAAWKLFPYNEIHEARLAIGDRVEVSGEVEQRPLAGDPTGLYRDAAPGVLMHVGLAVLGAGH